MLLVVLRAVLTLLVCLGCVSCSSPPPPTGPSLQSHYFLGAGEEPPSVVVVAWTESGKRVVGLLSTGVRNGDTLVVSLEELPNTPPARLWSLDAQFLGRDGRVLLPGKSEPEPFRGTFLSTRLPEHRTWEFPPQAPPTTLRLARGDDLLIETRLPSAKR